MLCGVKKTHKEVKFAVWGNTWRDAASLLGLTTEQIIAVHCVKKAMSLTGVPVNDDVVYYVSKLRPNQFAFCTSGSHDSALNKLKHAILTNGTCFHSCSKRDLNWWKQITTQVAPKKFYLLDDDEQTVGIARAAGVCAVLYSKGIELPCLTKSPH